MKNHFEIDAYVMNVKQFNYSKGTGYNFSFAMRGDAQSKDSDSVPTIWISGVSFKDAIRDKRNYLLRGKLQVKPPYNDYPAGLQLVVSEAIPLEENMYTVARKRQQTTSEDAPQAREVVPTAPTHKQSDYRDPVATVNPSSSEQIPF